MKNDAPSLRKEISRAFGAMVKKCRDEARLSQDKLAWKVGVTRPAIAAIENGIACPNLALSCALAHELGINLDTVLTIINPNYIPFDLRPSDPAL